MSELWKRLTKTDGKTFSVDGDAATQAFMDEMPAELREKKIGDKEALGELGEYRKAYNTKFGSTVARSMAGYLKDHDEVNEVSAGFTTPDGVGMHVDFARPTADDADAEEWGASFSHRQSLSYEEELTTSLRDELGNMFVDSDESSDDKE